MIQQLKSAVHRQKKRLEQLALLFPWLLKKIIVLPQKVIIEFTAAVFVLAFLSIRAFKYVKIFNLRVDRIGELANRAEVFLRRLKLGIVKRNNISYIGFVTTKCANEQLLKMYKREMFNQRILVINAPLLKHLNTTFLDYVLRSSLLQKSVFYHNFPGNSNEFYEFNNTEPILSFTTAEEENGKSLLKRMGINEDDWFICFNSRDPKYLDAVYSKRGWGYHSYRDCDIKNYMIAAEYISSIGGYAVRVGYLVAENLPETHNPKIIDYSLHHRTDFGDIYLLSKCKFFLANTTGLFLISTVFNVPVALANFVPLEYVAIRKSDLFIPKMIWSVREKRRLTFREILESGAGRYLSSWQFQKAGLEVVENTAEEVLDLAKEMNERLDGTWVSTEEDEELQRRFHSLFKPHHLCYGFSSRIGTNFLRKNKCLLE